MTDIKLCQFSKVVFDNGFKNKVDQYIELTVATVLGGGGILMILLLLLTINVIFNASLGISKVFPLLQASSILVIIITTMILLLTINIIVKGWCWKSLLGGGALYGPADWNGSLSGQEVRLSQD